LLGILACASEPALLPGVSPDAAPDVAPDAVTDAADAPAPDASSSVPPPAAGDVRVASLNVHRLFDTVCDSGSCGAGAYEEVTTPAELAARGVRIADALSALHPDVLLLQEIETQASLDAIGAAAPLYPSRVLGEIGTAASVDVAVMSSFAITDVVRHRGEILTRPDGTKTTFSRELLEVHLDARGAKLIVFVAHFRSKANDDPGRRLAEAQATQRIMAAVAAAEPTALVVLGGDLNDVPGSEPLLALEAGGALVRTSVGLPDASIATYVYNGVGEPLDHLFFATAGGDGGGGARYVAGSFHVAHDHATFGLAGSDHAGIYADFSGF
jgi:predicted extracellular nuclease